MPEKLDPQLDELRRRARRRLIGAIVLALAAAVLVPMLLESDPKPLGEDVSVKIPPVDDGKFVNKLGEKMKPPASPPAKAPTLSGPTAAAPTEPPAGSAGAKDAATKEPSPKDKDAAKEAAKEAKDTAKDASKDASKDARDSGKDKDNAGTSTASAAPGSAAPSATRPVADPAAASTSAKDVAPARAVETPASNAPSKPGEAASGAEKTTKPPAGDAKVPSAAKGSYSVQLAAFSDDKGANALAGRLKKAGHPAYTEPYNTSRGTLYRVRVGPYPTRDAAEAARAKLKADGQNGIIATAN